MSMLKYEYWRKINFERNRVKIFRYSLYSKKINGNSITLNNDDVHKRKSLLLVPKSTVSDEKNIILETLLKSEGVDTKNILETKWGENKLLEALK